MKLASNILLFGMLLLVSGSTNSSKLDAPQHIDKTPLLIPYVEVEKEEVTKEVTKEFKEVKSLLTSTQKELNELKVILEYNRKRDSSLIKYYVNQ